MPDRNLDVWLQGDIVGHLDQDAGRLVFTYDPVWLSRPNAIALSASLPLRPEPFDDRAARPFFAGLLPEQENREQAARVIGVSPRNDFALLDALGGECAGAVTFMRPGEKPVGQPTNIDYRILENGELAAILDKLSERPLLAGEEGVRLSLAGAQDKLPVWLVGDRVALPLHGAPSSHILKPAIRRIEDSVHNEGFCLSLAKLVGIDVVEADIREAGGRPYLLIDRYDRVAGPDHRPCRVHQEDFCQALGVAPEYKYQNEGGPSLVDCFALVRKATRPAAPSVLRLVDGVIFNALIGNHDAHAKNYSLIYGADGTKLAPLYDLLSTAIYPDLTSNMAMKIGGHYEFMDVLPRHWERFAKDAGLSAPQVRRRVLDLAHRLPIAAEKLCVDFTARGIGRPVIEEIIGLVRDRCDLTRKRFADVKDASSA
jgi:serine/threonine-protein kinase HipA